MRIYHQQVIRHGLAAPQPAPGFLHHLLQLAEAALERRGFGEETVPVRPPASPGTGCESRPARTGRVHCDGIGGLLAYTTIHRKTERVR